MQACAAQEGQPGNALLLVGPRCALQLLGQLNLAHLCSTPDPNGLAIRALLCNAPALATWFHAPEQRLSSKAMAGN